MSRRIIATLVRVKIYRDSDWDEYSVVPRRGSAAYQDRCSYHTSDKQDAFDTAAVMDKELIEEDDPAYKGGVPEVTNKAIARQWGLDDATA